MSHTLDFDSAFILIANHENDNMTATDIIGKYISKADKKLGFDEAEAHCDFPCGIYDPHLAQLSALTVVRMVDLIRQLPKPKDGAGGDELLDYAHDMARAVEVKEKHGELCKHEVRIIWGDYFKPEHLQKYPDLHQTVFNIMKFGSKARQEPDREAAMNLLKEVNKFAEIFWATKNVQTKRAKAPYEPKEEVVYPVL